MTKQESEGRARVACDLWVERMKRERADASLGNATVYEGPEDNRRLFCEVVGSFIAAAVGEEHDRLLAEYRLSPSQVRDLEACYAEQSEEIDRLTAAVKAEREACARLVEAGLEDDDAGLSDEICRRDVDLAAAIRKRGQQ